MIVLDTNYVSMFQYPDNNRAVALRERGWRNPRIGTS